ncbi:MAG: hypothetical protein V4635_10185 [Bacteroidota bacterium]
MKCIFVFFALALTFSSCKKSENNASSDIAQPEPVAEIVSFDIEPDIIMYNKTGVDTSYSKPLDVDQDGFSDFLLSLTTYSTNRLTGGHSPVPNHWTDIAISSFGPDNKIGSFKDCNNSSCVPYAKFLDSGQVINNSIVYFNMGVGHDFKLYNGVPDQPELDVTGIKYIPLILNNKYFAWIKVESFGRSGRKVIVKSVGFNRTIMMPIRAGERGT